MTLRLSLSRGLVASGLSLTLAGCGGVASSVTSTPAQTTSTLAEQSAPTSTLAVQTASTSSLSVSTTTEQESPPLVVRNGNLFDGTGEEVVFDAVVIVENGVVVAVGTESEIEIPGESSVVDARGGTILPGLIDTHTHLFEALSPGEGDLEPVRIDMFLSQPLASGITTFRDAGSGFGLSKDLTEFRRKIDSIEIPTPTVVAMGPIISHPEGMAALRFKSASVGVGDDPEAAATAETLISNGVDQIKIMLEEGVPSAPWPSLAPDTIRAIVDTAHQAGVKVVAHAATAETARLALDSGVDELTHWPGNAALPDDLIRDLARSRVPVGTTFAIIRPFEGDVRRLLDAGGVVVLSSDAPSAMAVKSIAQELFRMVQAGMTPEEAILASTRDAALALELEGSHGTVEPGKQADLLIVSGDPLADISVMGEVTHVIKAGQVIAVGGE